MIDGRLAGRHTEGERPGPADRFDGAGLARVCGGGAVNAQNETGVTPSGSPGGADLQSGRTSPPGAAATICFGPEQPQHAGHKCDCRRGRGRRNERGARTRRRWRNRDDAVGAVERADGRRSSTRLLLTQLGDTVTGGSEREHDAAGVADAIDDAAEFAGSSVSLDQEASNLTLYERSYDAAAKVFTIVDQLMASALNLGEETTVSKRRSWRRLQRWTKRKSEDARLIHIM